MDWATVEIEEPFKECAFCSGTGKNPLGARVTCIVCRGKGKNHCKSNTKCTQCNGRENGAMACPVSVAKEKGTNEKENEEC
jgi:DnaJ-class molecular chaperone